MNPINTNNPSVSFIQQKPSLDNSLVAQHKANNIVNKAIDTNQLTNLLLSVNNAPESQVYTERLSQIKAALNADTYCIDFDELVNNVLVSDHEL